MEWSRSPTEFHILNSELGTLIGKGGLAKRVKPLPVEPFLHPPARPSKSGPCSGLLTLLAMVTVLNVVKISRRRCTRR